MSILIFLLLKESEKAPLLYGRYDQAAADFIES